MTTLSMQHPDLPPCALYVHLPWCVQKCPYCDFNSHRAPATLPESDYLSALITDIKQSARYAQDRPISSIFIGGGTPSMFSANGIGQLIEAIDEAFSLTSDIEITLEANPGTSDQARFIGYRQSGVNRLSIGVQSFDNDCLSRIGRIHDNQQAADAVRFALAAQFDSINIDLMFGLPKQTTAMAHDDLSRAIALQPNHISLYQLTIEPNTYFYKYTPTLPPSDELADCHDSLIGQLEKHNFNRYEVSAFAQADHQCRHNLNYWQFGDYIGVGAGAHGKITMVDHSFRYWKSKHPTQYMQRVGREDVAESRIPIRGEDILFEFLMNALRLADGVKLSLMAKRTGLAPAAILTKLKPLIAEKLLVFDADEDKLRCSSRGYRLLDSVLGKLVPTGDAS